MSRRVVQTLFVILLVGSVAGGIAQAMPFGESSGGRPLVAQTSAAYCATPAEGALLELINGYRAERGLAPFVLVVPLGSAARHHAESMAAYNYFDFTLVPESASFEQNIHMYGYTGTYVGANIAAGPASTTAAVVFDQWLSSPSQNSNLLNPLFSAVGIGSASNPDASFVNYWAAAFGDDAEVENAVLCDIANVEPPSDASPVAPAATPVEVLIPVVTTISDPGGSPTALAASPVAETTAVGGVACATDRDVARAGQDVVVICAGFEPNEEVEVYWDQPLESAQQDSGSTDAGGSAEFVFPALEVPSRRYIIIVRSVKTRQTATTPIEIRPGLFLVPRSGDPGDVISADLTGFQPGEAVTIVWFDDDTTTKVLRQITVGEDGSWTTTFRAPTSATGMHVIEATGLGGGKATANYEIEAD